MLQALQYEFMRNALVAGILVSVACGIIGTYVVVNRIVFLAGGISHAAYGGIGLGIFLGVSPIAGAVSFSVAAAVAMGVVSRRARQGVDIAIGIMWAMGMALGIILIDMTPGYSADLMSYLFGSILAVPTEDLALMGALDLVIILTVAALYKEFLAISFDEEFASVVGAPVEPLYLVLLGLVALTTVMAMRVAGLILTIALLTMPAAVSRQFTANLGKMMGLSCFLAAAFAISGLWLSYAFDLTPGATIVMVSGAAFGLSSLYRALQHRRADEPAASSAPQSLRPA
ncbi:MAG: metal ABC transporter permease [Firmicutes bacterium]|jgi:zinc transport system permease protein|nr:metal ABC transporter permease [Bacillota bacterium]MDH7495795.1 metal ABC transporter permease [Bacillota bacterium]